MVEGIYECGRFSDRIGETERVCDSGNCEDCGGGKSVRAERGGSSSTREIVHFVVQDSGVMSVESQIKLIAASVINV